jgi:sugar phosphate permease
MSDQRPKTFYGWVVVFTAGIGLLLGYAPVFVYSFSIFIKSLAHDFHTSRTSISFAFTLANIMQSVGAPLIGRLVDRFGAQKIIVPSTIFFGLVLISFKYFSTSLWQLYAFFIVIGFIGTGTAPVPYGIVVSRWFDKRRGLALGLMMMGLSTGAILMPSIAQRLIALFGWRTAYAIVGFVVLAISVPIVGIFLKDSPEKMGLEPDGEMNRNTEHEAKKNEQGVAWTVARRQPAFWFLACAFFLVGASVHACVIHLVPMLTDHGISVERAAFASSLLGVALLLGRVFTGFFLDRFFGPYVAMLLFSGVAFGIALLWTGAGGSLTLLAAFLVGLGMGAEADIIAYLTSRYFGLRSFGEIYGYLFATFTLAGALGPVLMGTGYDHLGSYRAPLLFFLAATLVATALLTRLGPYVYRAGEQHQGAPAAQTLGIAEDAV